MKTTSEIKNTMQLLKNYGCLDKLTKNEIEMIELSLVHIASASLVDMMSGCTDKFQELKTVLSKKQ